MNKESLAQIVLIVLAIYCILGAYLEWDFLYKSKKLNRVIRLFGHSGAKIFYFVIGISIFTIALLDITRVIDIYLLFS
ncbi:Imm17 family immunity protein [Plebeiibacterium sediminum]|uniref:Imm17 family immunity protein n=1 Tax=Plebeiibacterium sediminum TaxID=2992112 RepID=A0AAE3M1Y5_9BACT|nr:Imm17 family immunity protein [Plebeiobacterium sediminum]MCW3785315.1 Imm17 family immunity protein [Plebeiobacterium sediminum]